MNIEQLTALIKASEILHNRVHQYLIMYRKYANGLNGVFIPDEPFSVNIRNSVSPSKIVVIMNYTRVHHYEVTQYKSPDDDDFSEAWGSDNSCGYTLETELKREDYSVTISMRCLLLGEQELINFLKESVKRDKVDKAEKLRLQTIVELETKLAKLKGQEASKK